MLHRDRHVFEVEHVGISYYVTQPDYSRDFVHSLAAKFARGQTPRVKHSFTEKIIKSAEIPASGLDILLDILVTCVPELNFGWFSPKYKSLKTIVNIHEENIYFNVYPLPDYAKGRHFVVDDYLEVPSVVDWLEGEAPTIEEIKNQRHELHRRIARSYDTHAAWMVLRQEGIKFEA